MDRDGLDKIKRAESLARLDLLERFIEQQEALVALFRTRGWDAKESERRLELLRESRRHYFLALMHQFGERFHEPQPDPDKKPSGSSRR